MFLPHPELQCLLDQLKAAGYRCIGPQVRDGAIVYDHLISVQQLPANVHDRQSPGHYRLEQAESTRYFAWANGPQALKPQLFAPRETLWRAERDTQGRVHFVEAQPNAQPVAIIGARPCDLAAMAVQDRVFLTGEYRDPYYANRRDTVFTVAVNCSHPADTCFCVSTATGPVADRGYDLLLTELDDGFLIDAGSTAGDAIAQKLPLLNATDAQYYAAGQQRLQAEQVQTRRLPDGNLPELLHRRLDHSRWDDVATRCLSCGNCTMVCPTCFCHREYEEPALDGASTAHYREWDSCFTEGHSYIHGKVMRQETKFRYRQWLTHKLSTWVEQFGTSGCVGCGRCISWCPAGIDITEETAAIAETEQ